MPGCNAPSCVKGVETMSHKWIFLRVIHAHVSGSRSWLNHIQQGRQKRNAIYIYIYRERRAFTSAGVRRLLRRYGSAMSPSAGVCKLETGACWRGSVAQPPLTPLSRRRQARYCGGFKVASPHAGPSSALCEHLLLVWIGFVAWFCVVFSCHMVR